MVNQYRSKILSIGYQLESNQLGGNQMLSELVLQTLFQFNGQLFVALLTARLQVDIIEFGLVRHGHITEGTGKVVRTPSFVQRCYGVAHDDLVAHKASVTKQLVVVSLTIR